MSDLQGKIALVTGASRGLVKRLLRCWRRRELGLSVRQPARVVRKLSLSIWLPLVVKE